MKSMIRFDLETSWAYLVVACLISGGVGASTGDEVKTTVQNIRSSSLEMLRQIRMNCGTNELLVVAPQELSIDLPTPAKVTLTARDLAYSLTVRVVAASAGLPSEMSKPSADWVHDNYPGARITEESTVSVGETTGSLFEFVWPVRGVRDRVCKVGLISTRLGTVEFVMVADPLQGPAAAENFHALLHSFQTNERGPIKLVPLPDHS